MFIQSEHISGHSQKGERFALSKYIVKKMMCKWRLMVIHMTTLPWLTFTNWGFSHKSDSSLSLVPREAWHACATVPCSPMTSKHKPLPHQALPLTVQAMVSLHLHSSQSMVLSPSISFRTHWPRASPHPNKTSLSAWTRQISFYLYIYTHTYLPSSKFIPQGWEY